MKPVPPSLLADLEERGLVHDSTDLAALEARLAAGPVSLYYGCDPSADSLHIGSLIGLLVLRRFQLAGHRPIALAGGATGMVGDPSGRSDERNLLDEAALAANVAGIRAQLARFVDFTPGPTAALLVDNASWTRPMGVLEFLRDVGKHVTVNAMLAKESVRSRLAGEAGISYTEFSYMLLQANDFSWLHDNEGCELQVGGSDQWGNITAGIDLIRRRSGGVGHGLTWPLLTRADGRKFGKSEGDNVWLAAERTSPYAFSQYFVNTPDADVRRFLLQLTLLEVVEVDAVVAEHEADPARRVAQRRLAEEVTALVHGAAASAAALAAADIVFGGDPSAAGEEAYEVLADEVPVVDLDRGRLAAGAPLVEVLVEAGLVASRGEARKALASGGVYVGGRRAEGEAATVVEGDLRHGRWLLVRRGKRTHALVRVVDAPVGG